MTTMTRVQAEALAAFVSRMRPEWRPAGIVAALEKAAPTTDAWDVASALLNLAADPTVNTPGLLDKPGPHWRRADGTSTPRRGDHNVRCPDHPLSVHPCPQCEAKRCPPPLDDPEYAAAKAALKGRQGPTPALTKPPQLTDAEHAAIARKRIDKEAH